MLPIPDQPESSLIYPHVLQAVLESPWAITPDALAVLAGILASRIAGRGPAADEGLLPSEPRPPGAYRIGPVGVLPLYGTIFPRANLMTEMSGATSLQKWMSQARRMAADPDVAAIVLDVDSPGGSVAGVAEAAAELREVCADKALVAVSNYLCASAAYFLASQADEIVASPSSITGSIGVFTIHQSLARALDGLGVDVTVIKAGLYKTEGNPYELLGEEAEAALQRMVDSFYDDFVSAVARGRGIRGAQVRDGLGQGRALVAADALAQGLVDRIDTLDATVARLQRPQARNRTRRRAEGDPPDVAADLPNHQPRQPQMTAEQLADQIIDEMEQRHG